MTKAIVLAWWAFKIRVSPNRKDIVKKRQKPHLYEENPTQYFMETQVLFIISIFVCYINTFLQIQQVTKNL
jgi:hypothetical protein